MYAYVFPHPVKRMAVTVQWAGALDSVTNTGAILRYDSKGAAAPTFRQGVRAALRSLGFRVLPHAEGNA